MSTDESDRRAFEAAIRNAALEAAAQLAEVRLTSVLTTNTVVGRGLHRLDGAIIRELAAAIRALKSDPAPVPATKPFTFADPTRQVEHERHRAENKGRKGE
jgi:hypothetical protein